LLSHESKYDFQERYIQYKKLSEKLIVCCVRKILFKQCGSNRCFAKIQFKSDWCRNFRTVGVIVKYFIHVIYITIEPACQTKKFLGQGSRQNNFWPAQIKSCCRRRRHGFMTQADSRRKWNINIFAFTKARGAATLGTQCKRRVYKMCIYTFYTRTRRRISSYRYRRERSLLFPFQLASFTFARAIRAPSHRLNIGETRTNATITLDPHKHNCFCSDL